MSWNVGDVILLLGALCGSGGVAAAVNAWQSDRAGVRTADVQKDETMRAGFEALTKGLQGEIARLREDREEDRDRIERQITVERDLKWSAIQHIRALYSWITHHISGIDPPAVPEDLAPRIVIPPRNDPQP